MPEMALCIAPLALMVRMGMWQSLCSGSPSHNRIGLITDIAPLALMFRMGQCGSVVIRGEDLTFILIEVPGFGSGVW